MKTESNDPINPCKIDGVNGWGNQATIPDKKVYGLTKREHFAALAMQGFTTNPKAVEWSEESIAEWSVKQADCLIEQLNKAK